MECSYPRKGVNSKLLYLLYIYISKTVDSSSTEIGSDYMGQIKMMKTGLKYYVLPKVTLYHYFLQRFKDAMAKHHICSYFARIKNSLFQEHQITTLLSLPLESELHLNK